MNYLKTLVAAATAAVSIGTAADALLVIQYGGTGIDVFDQDGHTNPNMMADATWPDDDFSFDIVTDSFISEGEYGFLTSNFDIGEAAGISYVGTGLSSGLTVISGGQVINFVLEVGAGGILADTVLATVKLDRATPNLVPDDERNDFILADWNDAGKLDELGVYDPITGAGFEARVDIQTQPVPVPAAGLLLLTGLGALALRRRKS